MFKQSRYTLACWEAVSVLASVNMQPVFETPPNSLSKSKPISNRNYFGQSERWLRKSYLMTMIIKDNGKDNDNDNHNDNGGTVNGRIDQSTRTLSISIDLSLSHSLCLILSHIEWKRGSESERASAHCSSFTVLFPLWFIKPPKTYSKSKCYLVEEFWQVCQNK